MGSVFFILSVGNTLISSYCYSTSSVGKELFTIAMKIAMKILFLLNYAVARIIMI